ncbi:MAG: hypothetical protein K0S75_867 [Clostridia bacterium]|jgi:phage-related minor tail protein|nr:hypothetical protein [Clostridia bacterium]
MASIKGITIEIGGNTQPLNKALEGVNKKSKDLQSELKQVDRLLKLDPSNTTLIEQKQKLLAEAIGNTKSKLDTLKETEKQIYLQLKEEGKGSEEQYRLIQREVIATTQNLESLENQAKKSNAVLSKDEAVGNLKNIAVAAGTAALAVGAAFVGLAAEAVNSADELQRQADVTGLTAERLQELQYAGNNLGVELETITGAQAKLTKAMYEAQDGTGTQADAFKALGISVVDSNGQMRDAKAVMEEAFTALNNVGNETERDALSMQIFGRSAMDMNPLIKAGGDELARLSEEARNNGAVMSDEAVAGLDAFGDTIDNLKSSVLGSFGEKFAEVLPQIQEFLEKLKELPEWIENNSTLLTVLGVVIGTIITLMIAFNIQQALMAAEMTLWSAIAAGATAVTTALGTAFAFLTSPIGLIILAIGAVIAAGVLLYKNWDTVKEKLGALGSAISQKFNEIKTGITDKINAAKDAIRIAIDKIKDFFKFKWELPKIKLPHFDVTGKFSLNPPQIPKFNIDWYDKGGVFRSPGIIGIAEKRPEFVGALDDLRKIVREEFNNSNGQSSAQDIYVTMPVYLEGKEIARSTSRIQAQNNRSKSRALGVVPV